MEGHQGPAQQLAMAPGYQLCPPDVTHESIKCKKEFSNRGAPVAVFGTNLILGVRKTNIALKVVGVACPITFFYSLSNKGNIPIDH